MSIGGRFDAVGAVYDPGIVCDGGDFSDDGSSNA